MASRWVSKNPQGAREVTANIAKQFSGIYNPSHQARLRPTSGSSDRIAPHLDHYHRNNRGGCDRAFLLPFDARKRG